MGVTGLWTVVQPCARPVKLETLNRKRLAVDASIWIYQFLKAVRDKEGNALRNAHVVGFFRRICKLLFFGIKPVFVFDGGAPILKRQTIAARKSRREGRREDAARTARKLLAIQMQRLAEEEEAKRKAPTLPREEEQEEITENPSYVDEIFMTEKEKRQNRKFRKKDAYHLPDLDASIDKMGAPDDPRIMSQEELEHYARQFYSGEEISLYDFSKIDFDSPFFMSLPASDRYNILNAARLRSRLRMGYSKEQLDSMFPDRMAFSKFQIERVKERNDLTQRLMNLNGMNGDDARYGLTSGQRIAGERGKEYVLIKNPDVEGGWALGVVGNKNAGVQGKPIDVDQYGLPEAVPEQDDEMDEDGFEDVPIEGLNRLPKLPVLQKGVFDASLRRQTRDVDNPQKSAEGTNYLFEEDDDDALFLPAEPGSVPSETQNRFTTVEDSEDEDLRRAVAMSMEQLPDENYFEDVLDTGKSRSVAVTAHEASPDSESDDDAMDFTKALAMSKKPLAGPKPSSMGPNIGPKYAFSGPLPFETLKVNKPSKNEAAKQFGDDAGGFERQPDNKEEEDPKKKKTALLPPWFSGHDEVKKDFVDDSIPEDITDKIPDRIATTQHTFIQERRSPEVIDVDQMADSKGVIDLESIEESSEANPDQSMAAGPPLMNEVAENIRISPPISTVPENTKVAAQRGSSPKGSVEDEQAYEWEASDDDIHDASAPKTPTNVERPPGSAAWRAERTPSPDFEDVAIPSPVQRAPSTADSAPLDPGAALFDDHDTALFDQEGNDYSDPEDEDLMLQLAAEAEEHARFASTFNHKTPAENAVDFERELKQLRNQQKKDRRDADEVTHIMISECQQLLRLFGLPYITAPMEAEAQCAELVSLGLVDGIVTDDSDTLLFGGTRVYKNMFNQSKFVECFLASDLEKEYALDRSKLIRFAHLLGSDYTEGIPGVGPVTALEIVTEFRDLEEFRDWWTQVQIGVDVPNDTHSAFRQKFKKNASKLFLPPSFPDSHIDTAYLYPDVDADPSEFQWGVPDLNGLRSFLMATIGWSPERTDEVLVPVIRDMNQREQEGTQSNITRYIGGGTGAGAFAPRVRSEGKGRMEKAFSRLRAEAETRKRASRAATTDSTATADAPAGSSKKRRTRQAPKPPS